MNAHAKIERTEKAVAEYHLPNLPRFLVGDVIEYQKVDGWRRTVTILGRAKNGDYDCMLYDGLPHYVSSPKDELAALRIVRITRMDAESVAMYRNLLGLDAEAAI